MYWFQLYATDDMNSKSLVGYTLSHSTFSKDPDLSEGSNLRVARRSDRVRRFFLSAQASLYCVHPLRLRRSAQLQDGILSSQANPRFSRIVKQGRRHRGDLGAKSPQILSPTVVCAVGW